MYHSGSRLCIGGGRIYMRISIPQFFCETKTALKIKSTCSGSVGGLIPGQGIYLGCGFGSLTRSMWEATDQCSSFSLPPFPSKINKHVLRWELKNIYK